MLCVCLATCAGVAYTPLWSYQVTVCENAQHAHQVDRYARGRCRSAFREQRRKLFTMGAKVLGIASYLGAPYKMIGKTLGVDGLPRLLRHLCATPASLAGLRFLLLLQG